MGASRFRKFSGRGLAKIGSADRGRGVGVSPARIPAASWCCGLRSRIAWSPEPQFRRLAIEFAEIFRLELGMSRRYTEILGSRDPGREGAGQQCEAVAGHFDRRAITVAANTHDCQIIAP